MKKKLFISVIFIAICTLLVGCDDRNDGVIVGGWKLDTSAKQTKIPSKALEAFNKAISGYKEDKYEVVALLGTQVVSGTNYMFFCKKVAKDGGKTYGTVVVYRDLTGRSRVTRKDLFNISDYANKNIKYIKEDSVGGWSIYKNIGLSKLSKKMQDMFVKATLNRDGIHYQPIALLGTQLNTKTNYAFLAIKVDITGKTPYTINVLTISKKKDNVKLKSVAYVDLADFSN